MVDNYTGQRPFVYQVEFPYFDQDGDLQYAETGHSCNYAVDTGLWTEPGDGGTVAYNDAQILMQALSLLWLEANLYQGEPLPAQPVQDLAFVIFGGVSADV